MELRDLLEISEFHRVRPIRPSLFVDKINEGGAAEDLSVHMMTLV